MFSAKFQATSVGSFLLLSILLAPFFGLYANSLSKPIVSARETLLYADLVLEGTVKEVLFKRENGDSLCFNHTYILVVDEVIKGHASVGDEVYIGQNIYSLDIVKGQTKLVVLFDATKEFIDVCGQSEELYQVPLAETKIFPGLAIGLYDIVGQFNEEYRVANCSKNKEFLFKEERIAAIESVKNKKNNFGFECVVVTGQYSDLRLNIENALR